MSYALEINGLKKTYDNGFEALKGIDLAGETGDFFALLGPNGAGKSTKNNGGSGPNELSVGHTCQGLSEYLS